MKIFSKILKMLGVLILASFFFLLLLIFIKSRIVEKNKNTIVQENLVNEPAEVQTENEEIEIKNKNPTVEKRVYSDISIKVPFTAQAPTGKWSNQLFQDGCEEASVSMAMYWADDKIFTTKTAEKEILNISAWEKRTFGFAVDSSVDDVARIIREYYKYKNIEVLKNIKADDIKTELSKGRILLVPMDGKVLANPHFTPPGPDEHMLVVTGYDSKTEEFITNDPGTKFGENFRYSVSRFMDAVWSYPSGIEHARYPGTDNAKKDAISISKS